MKKSLCSLLLALVLILSVLPVPVHADSIASGNCGSNVEWFITDDGTLNIGGSGAMYEFDMAFDSPPWEDYDYFVKSIVIGRGVTTISDFSFFGFYRLTSIEIPSTVTYIGRQAFSYCEALTEITLPSKLKELGNFAFTWCYELEELSIPASVTSIGRGIVQDCTSLERIEVDPDNSYYYNDSKGVLYSYNDLLVAAPGQLSGQYTIADGTTAIEGNAFHGCQKVTQITIPASVSSIGYSPAGNCPKLTAYSVNSGNRYFYNDSNGFLYSYADTLVQAPGAYSGHYTVEPGTVSLAGQCFFGCSKLTSVTIPASVTTVGGGSFEYCTSLSEIRFEGHAPEFSDYEVFRDVTATVYYPKNDSTWTSDIMKDYEGDITWVAYTPSASNPTEPTEPEPTEPEPTNPNPGNVIASGSCGKNATWTVDNNGLLTISGSGAMYDYEELEDLPWVSYWDEVTRIVVENGITAIGKQSLAGFSLVTQISLPSTLKTIGTYAFVDCTSLTSLQIPSGVTTISDGAFGYCHSLKSVTIPGTVQTLGTAIFYECYALTNVTLSEGLTTLSGGMFAYCTALQEITIPASVDTLKSSPFDGCTALESITFMGDAPTFASNSFKTVIATAYYPADNNTWTGSVCQDYGGDIMWISYGNGPVVPGDISWSFNNGVLTFSGTGAIADYESYSEVPWTNEYWGQIERVVINPGITHIGAYSFEFCYDLTSIEIPDTVTSIGTCAFYSAGLSTVTIPKNVTYIGNQAFDYCENLTRIQVASGNTAFYNDSRGALFTRNHHLIQVPGAISGHYSIPDGTVAIDDVGYCPNLTSLTIPASVSFLEPMLLRPVDTVLQVRFLGDAPEFNHSYVPPFDDYIVTIYYPSGNPTWTRSVMDAMGINITWVAYDPNDIPEDEPDNPSGELTNPFRDVKETDYFYNPVLWAVDNQITGGTSATTFGPHNACTRAQVVTFLWAAAGKPEPGSYHNPFTDVKTSDYFYKAVLWAVEKGITSGVSPTQFGSHQVCTRGQVVTFLWRAAGSPEASDSQIPFTDVKASDYFCKAVLWAVENGVTSGVSPGKFGPGNTCTRGQVVTFLYRAFNG